MRLRLAPLRLFRHVPPACMQGYRLEGFTGPLFTHLREDRLADVQDSHLLTQWLRQALLQDADTPGTSESAPASGPAAARRRRRSSATLSVGLGSRWSAAGGRPLVGGAAAALLSPPRERVSLPSTPKSCYTGMSPGTSVTGTVAAGPAAMFAVDVRSSEVACVHVRIVGADASSPQRFLRAGLALEYDLEWPLTHVFHDSVLEKYASVWRLLLLVKYVKSTLDELHHANRHVEAKIMASLRLYVAVLLCSVRTSVDYVCALLPRCAVWIGVGLHTFHSSSTSCASAFTSSCTSPTGCTRI